MRKTYPYRILIVEDDPHWSKFITSYLKDLGIQSHGAKSAQSAKELLLKYRFHFISCDMRIPKTDGCEIADVSVGVPLSMEISNSTGQLSLISIFTAQINPENVEIQEIGAIFRLAGALDIGSPCIKSIDGSNNPSAMEYSAKGWAENIQNQLLSFNLPVVLLEQGRGALPATVTNVVNRLLSSWGRVENGAEFVSYCRDLYQHILYLCWAQSQAFLMEFSGELISDFSNTDARRIGDIESAIKKLRSSSLLDNWRPYFLDPRDTGDFAHVKGSEQNIGYGIISTLRSWKQIRNNQAHEFTKTGWDEEFQNLRDPLLSLVDLLAFWAKFPLVSEFRFLDGRGTASVTLIRGQNFWQTEELTLDTGAVYEAGHVYLLHQGNTLIDLYPWLHTEVDSQRNNRKLFVLSHRDLKGGKHNWYRRELSGSNRPTLWDSAPKFLNKY